VCRSGQLLDKTQSCPLTGHQCPKDFKKYSKAYLASD
jgi:hypothetical protein